MVVDGFYPSYSFSLACALQDRFLLSSPRLLVVVSTTAMDRTSLQSLYPFSISWKPTLTQASYQYRRQLPRSNEENHRRNLI